MIVVEMPNAVFATGPKPDREHVVGPHAEADEADRDPREHHELVAEQRLAAEHRAGPRRRCRTPAGSGCRPRDGRTARTGAATGPGRRPASASKKCVPNRRSNSSSNSPTVMIGSENTSRSCTTSPIHTNTGMRKSDMPGARMLMTVTREVHGARRGRDAGDAAARARRTSCRSSGRWWSSARSRTTRRWARRPGTSSST